MGSIPAVRRPFVVASCPLMSIALDSPVAPAATPQAEPARAVDKETLRQLMQPSFWRWTIRILGDWSLIVGAMLLAGYSQHWAAYILAVIMSGVGQHRIAIMAHEGTHRQISRNKRLNDFLTGLFCLWPFGNPVGGYRRFHFQHHRHLNTPDDVELQQKAKSAPAWDLPATRWTVFKYFLQDVCLLHVKELAHLSQRVRPGINLVDGSLPNLWLLVVAGSLLWFGQWWVIIVWYLGTAMVFWPTFRLRVWTEHVGTHDVHRFHAPWYIRFWWLPHNTFCHYEHHYYPQVPCWHLPKLRKLMGDQPEIVSLFDILRNMQQAPHVSSGDPAPRPERLVRAYESPVLAEALVE